MSPTESNHLTISAVTREVLPPNRAVARDGGAWVWIKSNDPKSAMLSVRGQHWSCESQTCIVAYGLMKGDGSQWR